MKIQIGGLSEGIHRYTFTVTAAELDIKEDFEGDIHIEAVLDKSLNQTLLTASLRATGKFSCDRCVYPFYKELASGYTMVYIQEGIDTQHLDPTEVQVIPSGMHVINLADDVRQTMLLAVPFKLLCSDSCKGLCPSCGVNLNAETCNCSTVEVDSRWDQLRKLQSN